MHVRTAIARLLAATAEQTALKARIDVLRLDLHTEAVRRYREDGAAPTWNAEQLGKVRLDPPGDRSAYVADPDALGSWVAEREPDVATAVIELPPDALEAAIEAIRFAGLEVKGARVDVDPDYVNRLLGDVDLTIEPLLEAGSTEPVGEVVTATHTHPTTGEVVQVPGVGAHPAGSPRLVVTLDPVRKREAVEDALAVLEQEAHDDEVAEANGTEPLVEDVDGAPYRVDEEGESDVEPPVVRDVETVDAPVMREPVAVIAEQSDDGSAARAAHRRGTLLEGHREPYVGEGPDGAHRSAQIDREEADQLGHTDPRREALLVSAIRWEQQADDLDEAREEVATAITGRPVKAVVDGQLGETYVVHEPTGDSLAEHLAHPSRYSAKDLIAAARNAGVDVRGLSRTAKADLVDEIRRRATA